MAHIYAGILGLLAFLTSLIRGMAHGGGPDSILWSAFCCLLAFSAVGYVVGWVAGRTVDESVYGRVTDELAAQEAGEGVAAGGPPTTAT